MANKPLGAIEVGKRLRLARESKKWTQADLAERVGVDRSIIGNYELGFNYPAIPALVKLARTLDVSTDRLLGLEDERPEDIQDRRLQQLFLKVDRMDSGTQGLVKQLVERLVASADLPRKEERKA